eukprot:6179461-Pleurochrysis_carterae.AAC.5
MGTHAAACLSAAWEIRGMRPCKTRLRMASIRFEWLQSASNGFGLLCRHARHRDLPRGRRLMEQLPRVHRALLTADGDHHAVRLRAIAHSPRAPRLHTKRARQSA